MVCRRKEVKKSLIKRLILELFYELICYLFCDEREKMLVEKTFFLFYFALNDIWN